MIQRLKEIVPQLIGGSADLGPSNKTTMEGAGDFSRTERTGRNLHFVLSDYMKPMLRLAALMGLPVIYVLTHDSIGVGEDGPTHEPIEQLAMLRSTPNVNVFRPADAMETAAAWYSAVTSKDAPTILALTRQNLPQLAGSSKDALKGGYIISEAKGTPQGILIATGSEVSLAVEAQEELPKAVRARVAIEAASGFGWERYTGLDGATVTMQGFGASAPADLLFRKFGFTKENVVTTMKKILGR